MAQDEKQPEDITFGWLCKAGNEESSQTFGRSASIPKAHQSWEMLFYSCFQRSQQMAEERPSPLNLCHEFGKLS